jgi:hypothetical protein
LELNGSAALTEGRKQHGSSALQMEWRDTTVHAHVRAVSFHVIHPFRRTTNLSQKPIRDDLDGPSRVCCLVNWGESLFLEVCRRLTI